MNKEVLKVFTSNFHQPATLIGYCTLEKNPPYWDFLNRNANYRPNADQIKEPILSSSFINLRFVGLVKREKLERGSGLENFFHSYESILSSDGELRLPTFSPVIKCLGCGQWALLCSLEKPDWPFNSFDPKPLQAQRKEDLPPLVAQFEKTLNDEPINCLTWSKSSKEGLTSVCPALLALLDKDTAQKKKRFPEIHKNCSYGATRYGNGCWHYGVGLAGNFTSMAL